MSWNLKPCSRLLADVSLWSADLTNLRYDIERLSPYADSFHIDVADGDFASDLLFFPDMVAALRPCTDRPFHVHLIVRQPSKFVDRFAEAGADLITVFCEVGEQEAQQALSAIRQRGKAAGMSIRLDTPVGAVAPYLDGLDAVVIMGTEIGVKGRGLSPQTATRIEELAALLQSLSARSRITIFADGGVRRGTVPLLRAAGADAIVPGSLVFQGGDLDEVFRWIHSVG